MSKKRLNVLSTFEYFCNFKLKLEVFMAVRSKFYFLTFPSVLFEM